jgi:hypothetical protein
MVLIDGAGLVADFTEAAGELDLPGWPCELELELQAAPHRPHALPAGFGAVYAFALGWQTESAAGAGMVLKVGRVKATSNQRFQYHHYNPASVGSNLAKSLIGHPILWPWLGIERLDAANVRGWMTSNLDRLHIFVPGDRPHVRSVLELYVRARIGSVFEGSA